jgi:AAA15 family ATPase/GTPase
MEENLLKGNELFISKTDTFKAEEIIKAKDWIENNLVIIFPRSVFNNLVTKIATSSVFSKFANDLLKTFDTGVSELGIETTDFEKFFGEEDEKTKRDLINTLEQGHSVLFESELGTVIITNEKKKYVVKKVVALHNGKNIDKVSFDLVEESDGTKRLLDLIPAFDLILTRDITFIVDEIDQSLHPELLRSLIHKIMADESTKGQLVFSTHESNLLDLEIFRQDEIWFTEKEKEKGSTQIYSLCDFKPRYDLDIRKGYLKGRFGAIPFLADLNLLNWNKTYA